MTHSSLLLQVSIRRPAPEVYAYIANPHNLPAWAAGLSGSTVRPAGDAWLADSPMGRVKIHFAPTNAFGVADHEVTLPDGNTVYNPLRVQPNGDGAEVIFTLYRLPGVTDAAFAEDAGRVRTDLAKLKAILETKH